MNSLNVIDDHKNERILKEEKNTVVIYSAELGGNTRGKGESVKFWGGLEVKCHKVVVKHTLSRSLDLVSTNEFIQTGKF